MGKPNEPTVPKGNMKVFYHTGKVEYELDTAIRDAVKPFGYRFRASGCSKITGIRDLDFSKGK
jgi:hypothetical protein